jgi:hypothetical protein
VAGIENMTDAYRGLVTEGDDIKIDIEERNAV